MAAEQGSGSTKKGESPLKDKSPTKVWKGVDEYFKTCEEEKISEWAEEKHSRSPDTENYEEQRRNMEMYRKQLKDTLENEMKRPAMEDAVPYINIDIRRKMEEMEIRKKELIHHHEVAPCTPMQLNRKERDLTRIPVTGILPDSPKSKNTEVRKPFKKLRAPYAVESIPCIKRKAQPAKQATAKQATAEQPAAKEATAKEATAKQATAKHATAKQATAEQATAKEATAKQATAKQATAKHATAKQATDKQAQVDLVSESKLEDLLKKISLKDEEQSQIQKKEDEKNSKVAKIDLLFEKTLNNTETFMKDSASSYDKWLQKSRDTQMDLMKSINFIKAIESCAEMFSHDKEFVRGLQKHKDFLETNLAFESSPDRLKRLTEYTQRYPHKKWLSEEIANWENQDKVRHTIQGNIHAQFHDLVKKWTKKNFEQLSSLLHDESQLVEQVKAYRGHSDASETKGKAGRK